MAVQTVTMRNDLVDAYKTQDTHCALASTEPGSPAGTELSGGAPAYARRTSNWGATASGAATAAPTAFDVPSGATVAGVMFYNALTAGSYLDGATVTSQSFSSQGTYTVTATFPQS